MRRSSVDSQSSVRVEDSTALQRASAEVLHELFGARPVTQGASSRRIAVYVHLDDSDAATAVERHLSQSSAAVARSGTRVRADVSSDDVVQLLQAPAIYAVSLVERLSPCMDRAAQACALEEFKLTYDRRGQGVLIGIIDSGIDPLHPMFAGRIACVWDQTAKGSHGTQAGAVLQGVAVGAITDDSGHGTHVAGIAAGDDVTFSGVADQSGLVIVKSSLDEPDVVQGLYWLKGYATRVGMPMVVNLSMEGWLDPHDGSGALCEAIDDLSGPGFIICCASGNTGAQQNHAETALAPGESFDVEFDIQQAGSLRLLQIKGWADNGARLEVSVRGRDGRFWHPKPGPAGSIAAAVAVHSMNDADVDLVFPKSDPAFDDAVSFLVTFTAHAGKSIDGRWSLRLTNRVHRSEVVHLWCAAGSDLSFHGRCATDRVKVASPGAAARAITVGAMVTRTLWEDENGVVHHDRGNRRYHVGSFSSPGPLRSAAHKPDLVAPGVHICSARSATALVPQECAISPQYRLMAGSSMATPFVAGVVALMLEEERNMLPEEAKSRLQAVCAIPGRPAGDFDERWGYGFPELVLL